MSTDEILSTIASHRTSSLIYSSFGFYGRGRGGELPGLWLVHALQELDVAEPAVRQTLYRMEASAELRALQDYVEGELSPLGFAREARGFHPHLTLGRARAGAGQAPMTELADQRE
ncbi:MAG: hypothetical protein HY701_04475, partial [Gemmatimonadetes bacterium]|nr:hypothetical protein [Gemmatimonadota bacterium]